ncbi:hypothetical protein J1605_003318 [Eschrichtius robustus]|uniref:Aquaporin-10 n=1 Tax=Eschrichtius robustus TaxID=9764 RepID=A0AB34HRK6_ESCRO|nr:hypothetical protein J1605_003318 [Eschrichtius robustus]
MFLAGSLGVRLAIYVSGNVSGAHLNPAFSLAMCLLGCLPWAKFPIYSLMYALYHDALQNYTGGNLTVTGPKETASIFVTYPVPYLSLSNGFLDQVLGTWMLIVGILAILDTRNKGVPAGVEPVRWQWLVVGPLVRATLSTATHQRLVPLHHPEHSEPAQDLECAQPEASDLESPAATQVQESKL